MYKRHLLIASIISFALITPLFAALDEIRVEDTQLTVTPKIKLFIPNGVVNIFLEQNIVNTVIGFGTKYDFLHSYINTKVDFKYNFPKTFFGVNLSDEAFFEAVFLNESSIQRSKRLVPYVGYNFTKKLSLRNSLGLEDTYTFSTVTGFTLDKGRNVTNTVGLLYDNVLETEILSIGSRAGIDVKRSLYSIGGNYDYTQLDMNLTKYFQAFINNQYVKTYLQFGYPVDTIKKPLSEIYYLGGYEILQGYELREFRGNAMIYGDLSYNLHLFKVIQDKHANTSMEIVTSKLIYQFGKTGEKEIYNTLENFKSSIGIGFGLNLTFLKAFNTKFDFSLFQPFEQPYRSPVTYFNVSAISYLRK